MYIVMNVQDILTIEYPKFNKNKRKTLNVTLSDDDENSFITFFLKFC